MAALTEKEKLILSMFMYYDGVSDLQGETLGDIVDNIKNIDKNVLTNDLDGMLTADDFYEIADTIKGDPNLCDLKITKVTPHNSDITAACFETASGEPVVAFEGSGGTEFLWAENVMGGIQSDTISQREALQFVREVSTDYEGKSIEVTGHSAGGNMAEYCAIKCAAVGTAVSFDGQGFSKNFREEYAELIDENKGKITAVYSDTDFVHTLLTPIADPKNTKCLKYQRGTIKSDSDFHSALLMLSGHSALALYQANSKDDKYGDFTEYECVSEQDYIKSIDVIGDSAVSVIDGIETLFGKNVATFVYQLIAITAGTAISSEGMTLGEFESLIKEAAKRFISGYDAIKAVSFTVDLYVLGLVVDELNEQARKLEALAQRLEDCMDTMRGYAHSIRVVRFLIKNLRKAALEIRIKITRLSGGLNGIKTLYESCEYEVADLAGF